VRTDVGEHGADGGELALRVVVGAVDDVQQQVGVPHLLQRGAEGLDRTKPTVSARVNSRPLGVCALRTVGSSVANSAFSTRTPAPVRRLSSELLPALV
jgi:hypothetical protein